MITLWQALLVLNWLRRKISILIIITIAQYAYISATSPSQSDKRGWLISKTIPANKGPVCVSFYYNMNGRQMGALNFLVRKLGKLWLYWQRKELQTGDWKQGAFSIRKQNVSYEVKKNEQKLIKCQDTQINHIWFCCNYITHHLFSYRL